MTAFDLTPAAARTALGGVVDADLDDDAALDAYARAAWSVLTEPGDGVAGSMIGAGGAVEALRRVIVDAPRREHITGEYGTALQRWVPRLHVAALDTVLRVAERRGVRLITASHPEWPAQLDDLGVHVPIGLWARGRIDVLPRLRPSYW